MHRLRNFPSFRLYKINGINCPINFNFLGSKIDKIGSVKTSSYSSRLYSTLSPIWNRHHHRQRHRHYKISSTSTTNLVQLVPPTTPPVQLSLSSYPDEPTTTTTTPITRNLRSLELRDQEDHSHKRRNFVTSTTSNFGPTRITKMNSSVGSDEGLLASAKAFIPPLSNALHKGQAGRIAIIGGSEEYTGAPYFAALSSLKVGADLAHIFCVKNASGVIKSYSPELIVHPILDNEDAVEEIMNWAPKMHSFVIGCGLGQDPKILQTVSELIQKIKELEKPMIIDADGLSIISANPDLIRNYHRVILTPNSMEFSRLCNTVFGGEFKPVPSASAEKIRDLSLALGNVTILSKGATDVASNGRLVVCCSGGGSNRRCGGQGDLLAGALAVLFHWALAFGDKGDAPAPPELLASYGACKLTRECARLAYSQNGRSTTTSDMIRLIHQAFTFLFGP